MDPYLKYHVHDIKKRHHWALLSSPHFILMSVLIMLISEMKFYHCVF